MFKVKRNSVVLALLLLALGIYLLLSVTFIGANGGEQHGTAPTSKGREGPQKLSQQAKQNIGLTTYEVELKPIEAVLKVNGVIKAQPNRIAAVSSPLGGIVQKIYKNLGDKVQKGQPLAEIQSLELNDLQIEFIQAHRDLSRLETTFDQLRKTSADKIALELRNQQIELKESFDNYNRLFTSLERLKILSAQKILKELEDLQSELLQADAEAKVAEAALQRVKALSEKEIAAKKELIEKEAEYKKAKSSLQALHRKLKSMGINSEQVEKLLQSGGEKSIVEVAFPDKAMAFSFNPEPKGDIEKLLLRFAALLEDPRELVEAESELKASQLEFEGKKKKLLAAGVKAAESDKLLKGESDPLSIPASETLLEQYLPLLEAANELVQLASEVKAAETELEANRQKLSGLGFSPEAIEKLIQNGKPDPTLTLKSPISGIIVESEISLAQNIEPNEKLLQILDHSAVWLEGDVLESYAASIRPGQAVRVRVIAYPGEHFSGQISGVSASLSKEKRALHFWAELKNPQGKLKSEMFAEAAVVLSQKPDVVVVPIEAVLTEGIEKFVIMQKDDEFVKQPVVIGSKDDRFIEIKDGLFPGDIVVTKGNYELAISIK
jgi:RND family efflux transporter MFP subunit